MIGSYFGFVADYYPAVWNWWIVRMQFSPDVNGNMHGNGLIMGLCMFYAIIFCIVLFIEWMEEDILFSFLLLIPILLILAGPLVPLLAVTAALAALIIFSINLKNRKTKARKDFADKLESDRRELKNRADEQHAALSEGMSMDYEEASKKAAKLLSLGFYGEHQPPELDWKSIGVA